MVVINIIVSNTIKKIEVNFKSPYESRRPKILRRLEEEIIGKNMYVVDFYWGYPDQIMFFNFNFLLRRSLFLNTGLKFTLDEV